ncbi:sodium:proton exchanger [Candidatus Falkowbacteria bacterium RIFOXYC2_FULL_47_12]|uniref:Sodium:proton exchanger n=2 Tax=Candidatus Falkowiibacteriota TaxID=1752728 RepID=A0A1F5TLK4_9BACT|nr:MAG: sodium:proton exchanger [Candidatus Falkowbacteria bacterium RIFOXYA2_FULL_47_9]OGF39736.1 MAG: sodium:proton exchanger [Candidatus Falkowbacteria bacterium RIFOXYC2_FULL_47_12]
MLTYILFVIGFALLIKGAGYLVEGASAVGKRLGLSSLFIGLTIVAFGTSAPELFVNIIASVKGNADIAIGNIVGSNIINILFILGIAAIIYPLNVHLNTTRKEIPFSLLAVVVLGLLVNDGLIDGYNFNVLSRSEGLVLLGFFIVFMYYTVGIMREGKSGGVEIKAYNAWLAWLMVAGGLVGLMVGAKWVVDGGVAIAHNFGLSEALIGLTLVAVGTSLPELATSAVAAYKRQPDIAIGNVVGSNIFNIFWILGVSAFIRPIEFSPALNSDILVLTAVTILLLVAIYVGKRNVLQKWEGYGFLLLYILYVAFLVYRG